MNSLNGTDADISIFFVKSNGIKYFQQVFDLVLRTPCTRWKPAGENVTFYVPLIKPACLHALIPTVSG